MPEIGNFVISFVRVLFFISPGLVPLSQVSGAAHDLLLINPMTGLFESYRDALLYGDSPGAFELLYPAALGVVLLRYSCRSSAPSSASSQRSWSPWIRTAMTGASIRAEGLGVRFLFDRHQRAVTPALARAQAQQTQTWGVHEMEFTIAPGEGVALIGPSGSGKTTVLRLIAGVLSPDAGRLDVNGRVGSLLSTEAGLLWLLTGRENAALLGVLAGMSRADWGAALEAIKETTRLEDAFERPVLSYSEGMRARLGFAVADHTEPDILVLDEVHEALDHEFRQIVAERAQGSWPRRDRGGGRTRSSAARDHLRPGAAARRGAKSVPTGPSKRSGETYIGPSDA